MRQVEYFSYAAHQVIRHDAFTEIAQLDHKNHPVGKTSLVRFEREFSDDLDFGVAADIGVSYDAFGLTWHG